MLCFFIVLVVILANTVWDDPESSEEGPDSVQSIVGDFRTTIRAHPYIVSVLEEGLHVCGGTIISYNWIVTAAHCFLSRGNIHMYSIRAGSAIHNSGGQDIAARKIMIHPNFNRDTKDFDVALIQLAGPITIAVARAVAMANEKRTPVAGTTATITGWGHTSEGGLSSNILQVVQVPIVSQANCRAAYRPRLITDRMQCASLLGIGGRDSCQSDSGGPLMANRELTGIVSWRNGCARPYSPGVYVSVPRVRSWIRELSGV